MPDKALVTALVAGLLSSGLFLVVFGAGLGFLFMFLPTLPLFFLGLSRMGYGYKRSLTAALAGAAGIITAVAGPASAALYLVFLGLPAAYFCRKALLHLPATAGVDMFWYPLGLIILKLSLWASMLVALMTWYYASLPGGLPQLLTQNIREAFTDLQGNYGDIIESMASAWSFLMFPITIWLWGMLVFAHAWIANRILVKQDKHVRPDMVFKPFVIPSWVLSLLAICALASLIGSPSMSFLGKSTLLSLMLPYFFLGCTIMHRSVRAWPSGRFFLLFVYVLVFTLFWPFLIVAGFGLVQQIKSLSGHVSSTKR